jgi:hypothetical protein
MATIRRAGQNSPLKGVHRMRRIIFSATTVLLGTMAYVVVGIALASLS